MDQAARASDTTDDLQQQQEQQNDGFDDDFVDDTPEFLDPNEAVEVKVDDGDVPMDADDDDDDDEMAASTDANDADMADDESPEEDMARVTITSHSDSVFAVSCHILPESGKLLVASGGGDDKAFLHQISTTPQLTVQSHPLPFAHSDSVSSVAFNLDFISEDLIKTPKLLVVGSYDGNLLLYDPDSGAQTLKLEGPSDIEWIACHPKGGSVVLCGSGDGTVWMFHVPLKRCLQVFVGHEASVTAGAFTPDGKWALSASADGTLRVWAPKTGKNRHVFNFQSDGDEGGPAALTCLATKGGVDEQLVMVGAEDGMAYVCHVGTKKVVASLRHFEPPAQVSGMGNSNGNEGDEEIEMEYPMSVETVGFCPNNPNWCATGGVDGALKIWDLTNNQCRHVCRGGEGDGITRLTWHPTLPLVLAATSRGRVHIWDARDGRRLHSMTGHKGPINDMDVRFSGATAIIATAGDDKTVRLFEADINSMLQTA